MDSEAALKPSVDEFEFVGDCALTCVAVGVREGDPELLRQYPEQELLAFWDGPFAGKNNVAERAIETSHGDGPCPWLVRQLEKPALALQGPELLLDLARTDCRRHGPAASNHP